ncbi:MAG: short-chain dehydrogenase, partial [Pseudomonadota bacterium]|nr:short-chain dehydrogenase [Pseudomonadota bacterium]
RGLRSDLKGRGIIVALMAPGMVGTQLLADSGWDGPSLTTDESVAGMAPLIAGLTTEDKGTPTNVTGRAIPW